MLCLILSLGQREDEGGDSNPFAAHSAHSSCYNPLTADCNRELASSQTF